VYYVCTLYTRSWNTMAHSCQMTVWFSNEKNIPHVFLCWRFFMARPVLFLFSWLPHQVAWYSFGMHSLPSRRLAPLLIKALTHWTSIHNEICKQFRLQTHVNYKLILLFIMNRGGGAMFHIHLQSMIQPDNRKSIMVSWKKMWSFALKNRLLFQEA